MIQLTRSLLFVPGNRPDRFIKARDSGADAYCVDLQDAVPAGAKSSAREAALEHVATDPGRVLLRLNGLASRAGLADLLALQAAGEACLPAGLVLPLVASPFEIRQLVAVLGSLPVPRIFPMIETPEGLAELPAILAEGGARIEALIFGCADYAAATGSDMSWDALLSARSQLVAIASGHGIPCIDGPWFDVNDVEGMEQQARRVASLGFSGQLAIHPAQVEAINRAFTPSPQKRQWAQQVVAAFERSEGGAVSVDGVMVDQPLFKQAQRILSSTQE